MTFRIDGFLSPSMEKFRATLRTIPEFKAWLDFASELNRYGNLLLDGHETPCSDNQKLTVTALFVRAHKSLVAALVLAETGLVGDARAVLRSAVEGVIAIRALVAEPKFLDEMTEAHDVNMRKIARLILDTPDYAATYSAPEIAKMTATVAAVDAKEAAKIADAVAQLTAGGAATAKIEAAKKQKLRDITWSNVGTKYCKDLYECLYRLLSTDGTHTNVDALNRMFDYSPSGMILGVKVGPDIKDMVETLKAGCLMFLWAAESFITLYGLLAEEPKLRAMMVAFDALPQNDPPNVNVIAG